ncbi:MAG: hypothetical protein ACKKL6_00985 [Candidatus Komeilibacteria bacterium]
MFEDLQSDQQAGVPKPEPVNTPKQPPMAPKPEQAGEIEDILADVDSSAPSVTPKQPPMPAQPPVQDIGPAQPLTDLPGAEVMDKSKRSGGSKKLFYLVGIVVVAAIVIIGVIKFTSSASYDEYENFVTEPVVNNQVTDNTEDTTEPEVIDEPEVVDEVVEKDIVDDDGDGITNEQELAIGTDPFNPDSDNDGLFDKEEVVTYGTDPLNEDSDGDGYLDGAEVKAGYNPSGPGELLKLPPLDNGTNNN